MTPLEELADDGAGGVSAALLGAAPSAGPHAAAHAVPHATFAPLDAPPPPPQRSEVALPDDPCEGRRILRNLLVISTAFMVHFTAFVGATNLQSSVNAEKGLGTVSLALSYGSLILSTIFLPAAMIRWLGCKGALVASFVSYMPYMAAQFAASYATVAPTALLLGLGGGPFWCAQCLYVCALAAEYARRRRLPREVVVVRFFGIFYTVYEFGQIFGNLVSSLVLGASWAPNNASVDVRELCGPAFCPGHGALTNPNLERPPDVQIYTVAGVYLAFMAISVLVLVFGLDSLRRYGGDDASGSPPLSGTALLRSAGLLLRERNQQLLLPLTVWLGLEKAAIAADYTAAFVSCAWGIRYIGYVMICYGAANSAAALLGGWAVKATGRAPVVLTAALTHTALLLGLLHWRPHPDDAPLFFGLAAVWGACDGVWNVQVNAMCGILSLGNEKAAYSLFRLWESAGYILAYGYSAYVCAAAKLYVVLGLLLVSVAGYVAIEVRLRRAALKVVAPAH